SGVSSATDADLPAVQGVRGMLGEVFGLTDTVRASMLVNKLLSKARVQPRLTDHDGYQWHMHYFVPGASLAEHLALEGGMALAHVITADQLDRLRVCEAPDCTSVLVDMSRNRSKRYCDAQACGNRLHVAAYRERKRAELA
ncbi:MAG: CGNR zinc finger domain-containing protein, partial [Nocardioidaceae bacterium]